MSVPSTYACEFVDTDLPGTCRRYDDLVTTQRCPHISKTPLRPGLELYAVMDSNCHHAPTGQQVCEKDEGTLLRIVAKLADQKSTFPIHLSAEHESHDAELLRFLGGRVEDGHSILPPKKPLLIAPMYAKRGRADYNADHVRVEREPEDELKSVPVEIRFCASRGANGKKHTAKTSLNVAVPPHPDGA